MQVIGVAGLWELEHNVVLQDRPDRVDVVAVVFELEGLQPIFPESLYMTDNVGIDVHFNTNEIQVLQTILGHSNIKMTAKYARFSKDHLTDAVRLNPLNKMDTS